MILPLLLALQTAASDKLPPAKPVPYADPDTTAVMAPIDALFRAMAANDGAGVIAQVRPEGGATAMEQAAAGGSQLRRYSWPEFAALFKPGAPRLEERLSDPAIEVDGDVAMVWAPYTLTMNGKPLHCGTDHFDLVRDGGRWKILNVTWSSRTSGCSVN
jgi:hypothetical protein